MKNMKSLKLIFASLVCLFFLQVVQAQDVDNVRVSTTDKEVLVTYDLIGESNKPYLVDPVSYTHLTLPTTPYV